MIRTGLTCLCVAVVVGACADSSAPTNDSATNDASANDSAQPDAEMGFDAVSDPDSDLSPDAADSGLQDSDGAEPEVGLDLEEEIVVTGCDFSQLGSEDGPRPVMVGFPFSEVPGEPGTFVGRFLLTEAGQLQDPNDRLDVGFRPRRIEFVPSGALALVLGENGELASVRTESDKSLEILSEVQLPSADFTDLRLADGGTTAFVVGNNVAETSGVSTVTVDCEGRLTVNEEAFLNIRLAESLVLLPGEQQAILLGGQTVFEPIDDNDLRWLQRTDSGWSETSGFDIWGSGIDSGRMALSPDGETLVIPNGSPYSEEGNQVLLADIGDRQISEDSRLLGYEAASDAIFSPDGHTFLVTQWDAGRVVAFSDAEGDWEEAMAVSGVGLAEQIVMVSRGTLSGLVIVPSVDPAGEPNLAMLRVTGPGQLSDLGQLDLGAGFTNIPDAIAVAP